MSDGSGRRRLETSSDDIDVSFLVEANTVLEAAAASVALSGLSASPTVLQTQFELEFEQLNDVTLQNHFAAQDKSYTMTFSEIATATIVTQAPTTMPTALPTHSPTSVPTSQPTVSPTMAPHRAGVCIWGGVISDLVEPLLWKRERIMKQTS